MPRFETHSWVPAEFRFLAMLAELEDEDPLDGFGTLRLKLIQTFIYPNEESDEDEE
jgi:hypothetical protein